MSSDGMDRAVGRWNWLQAMGVKWDDEAEKMMCRELRQPWTL